MTSLLLLQQFPPSGSAFIQGARRGIGLALVEALLGMASVGQVYATCRRPQQASRLQQLAAEYPQRLSLLPLEMTDEASIAAAVATVAEHTGALHLLINCAGVLHDPQQGWYPEKKLADIRVEALHYSFAVNAVGPLLMAKHSLPLFRHQQRAVLANISARVGSISDNRLGGWYAYRGSKAAQNMFTRTIAIEYGRRAPNTICVALHPGTTDTDLSQPFQSHVPDAKLFSPEFTAQRLLSVIDGLNPADSGGFFAWDGTPIPW